MACPWCQGWTWVNTQTHQGAARSICTAVSAHLSETGDGCSTHTIRWGEPTKSTSIPNARRKARTDVGCSHCCCDRGKHYFKMETCKQCLVCLGTRDSDCTSLLKTESAAKKVVLNAKQKSSWICLHSPQSTCKLPQSPQTYNPTENGTQNYKFLDPKAFWLVHGDTFPLPLLNKSQLNSSGKAVSSQELLSLSNSRSPLWCTVYLPQIQSCCMPPVRSCVLPGYSAMLIVISELYWYSREKKKGGWGGVNLTTAIVIDCEIFPVRLEMGTLEDQHSLRCQVPKGPILIPAKKHLPRRAAPRRQQTARVSSPGCFQRAMRESKRPSSTLCPSSPRNTTSSSPHSPDADPPVALLGKAMN